MKNKINDVISQVNDKILEYSKIYKDNKDALIDTNALELFDDISKGIKLIHTIGKTFDLIKFNKFLKGLGKGEIREEDIEKLVNYIDNSSKADFIAQTFKKIVVSNSKNACCLLGLLYFEVVDKNKEINYEELIIYDALDKINDIDIDIFYELFRSFKLKEGEFITDEQIKAFVDNANISKSSVEVCLQKLGQLSLFKYDKIYKFDLGEDGNLYCTIPEFGFTYKISNITINFFDIVNKFMVFCK